MIQVKKQVAVFHGAKLRREVDMSASLNERERTEIFQFLLLISEGFLYLQLKFSCISGYRSMPYVSHLALNGTLMQNAMLPIKTNTIAFTNVKARKISPSTIIGIAIHKPHPSNIVKVYAIKQVSLCLHLNFESHLHLCQIHG